MSADVVQLLSDPTLPYLTHPLFLPVFVMLSLILKSGDYGDCGVGGGLVA